jgi:hypothetical protein
MKARGWQHLKRITSVTIPIRLIDSNRAISPAGYTHCVQLQHDGHVDGRRCAPETFSSSTTSFPPIGLVRTRRILS